jgi:hypothetical protein
MFGTHHRDLRRRAIALVGATFLAVFLVAVPATGTPGTSLHHRTIAPGVALTTYIDGRTATHAYVLWIDPSQGASLGMALANGRLGDVQRTSVLAKNAGAIAAVNGDFGSNLGRPTHPFVMGGALIQSSPWLEAMFSISSDGTMQIGKPTESLSVTDPSSGEAWPIAGWNHGSPAPGELAAYTAVGGTVEAPKPFTCSARLLPAGASTPTSDGTSSPYTVDQAGCFSDRLGPGDGVVLSAVPSTDEATFIRTLSPGENLHVDWSLGWPGISDGIGGFPLLVENGQIALGPCSGSFCGRNPRTGIGLTADGRIVLVVVDGRRSGAAGMSLLEFARFMLGLGVVSAMNLDGGGSSTMVIKGQVVNQPSDGFERSVTNGVVVLR